MLLVTRSGPGFAAMNIEYNVQIWKEGDQFVAQAMPLDVSSVGETPDQAHQALHEAMDLFLETATEMGTLTEILEECGYEFRHGKWSGPSLVAVERHSTSLVT
jgi:predicted RNase H-like HicB family nuclease